MKGKGFTYESAISRMSWLDGIRRSEGIVHHRSAIPSSQLNREKGLFLHSNYTLFSYGLEVPRLQIPVQLP